MAKIESCSHDAVTERNLFMLELAAPRELPPHIDVGSKYFGTFVAWDARAATHSEIVSFIKPLMDAGSVYFVCWGPDCKRVHDIADECDPYKNTDSVIMTTWNDDESLDDATWYFLNTMFPDAAFEDAFQSSLAISIGSQSWASAVRAALLDPRSFSARVLANESAV
jgi:hypothetical protein